MFEELACGLLFCYFIGWGCIYKVIKVPGDKITWGRSWILQIFFLWKCQGKNLHGDESSGDEISAMKVQSWNVQAKNIQWIIKVMVQFFQASSGVDVRLTWLPLGGVAGSASKDLTWNPWAVDRTKPRKRIEVAGFMMGWKRSNILLHWVSVLW